jgi:REP element-mobilizing transposase RayT
MQHEMRATMSPSRKRTRMDEFDCTTPGCYFVTINARQRREWFGTVSNGQLVPDDARVMVLNVWEALPERFRGIMIDAVIVMPDHIHGIVMLGTEPDIPAEHSLSDVIGAFKSISWSMGVASASPAGLHTTVTSGIAAFRTPSFGPIECSTPSETTSPETRGAGPRSMNADFPRTKSGD